MTDEERRHDEATSPTGEPGAGPLPFTERTTHITYGESGEPEWIGPYHVLQEVGQGGMGVVYEAEQSAPVRRRVALKLMKQGLESREAVARFESERQALALMNHPHIAQVLDAGTTDQGRPFFVMEFVVGAPMTDYCDRRRLTTRERLDLFVLVCEAVQHAHQKGIIHRDIKPSNILVSDQDGQADPKIIDFGVAKAMWSQRLTEKTLYTQLGMFVGTPEYSSPEQAEMSGDVDTRADVYSLGMLLYELLVGRLPFDAQNFRQAGPTEMLRVIREVEPERPSTRLTTLQDAKEVAQRRRTDTVTLRRLLRGDLDWIILRALEKDRGRRYQSASELAADIARHLRHEPVVAGPQSAGYRLRKFVRRHRGGVVSVAVVVALLTASATIAVLQWGQTVRERDRANREALAAREVTDFLVRIFEATDPRENLGSATSVDDLLDRAAERIDRELRGQPLLQARMMYTMGCVYHNIGRFDDAARLLESSLRIRRSELPTMHPDIAQSLARLGWEHYWRRKPELGIGLVQEALAIQQAVLAPDHIDAAWSRFYLASCQMGLGCFVAARAPLAQARDVFAQKLGEGHYSVGWSWNDIGLTFLNVGDYESAQVSLRKSLAVQREHLPAKHVDLAIYLINLVEVMLASGDPEAAEPFLNEAFQITDGVLSPDHPLVAFCLRCRGDLLLAQDDVDAAEVALEQAMHVQRDMWGENSDEFGRSLRSMADVARARGDWPLAERRYRRAIAILETAFPSGHIYLVEALEALANLLDARHRSTEAAAFQQRARDMREVLTQPRPECG